MKKRMILAFISLAALPGLARADMIWSDAYKSPMSSWGAYMYDQNVKRHLRERTSSSAGQTAPAASAPAPATPSAPISATDFTRSANGKDVVAQFISTANLSGPEAEKLAAALRSTMAQFAAAGRKDNIATAMTLLIGLSYGVLEKPGFDPNRADDLIPLVNDGLAASPQFKSLAALDRQSMYDSLLLSASVIAILHQSGNKQASQTIAKQNLQQLLGSSSGY